MKNKRRAFSTVELLVAISIIVILVSMITIGVQKVIVSSKASTTKGLLQTGFSLLEEWRRPGATDYPTFPWPADIVPGDLADNGAGLNSAGFQLSRAAMYRMAGRTAVKTLMGKMPGDRFAPTSVDASLVPTAVPNAPIIGFAFKASFDDRDASQRQRFFICFNAPPAAAKLAAPTATDPQTWPANYRDYWMESAGTPILAIKDAWNNPTLLIPSCGFQVTDLDGHPILVTSDGVKTHFCATGATFLDRLVWGTGKSYAAGDIVIAPLAKAPAQWGLFMCSSATAPVSAASNQPDTSGGKALWDRVPSVPFFASAGPDGIFFDPLDPKTLQDNIYSFEN